MPLINTLKSIFKGTSKSNPTTSSPVSSSLLVTLGVKPATALAWCVPLSDACLKFDILTKTRKADFLSNVLHETGMLERLEENLDYSFEGLLKTWPNRFTQASAYAYGRVNGHPAIPKSIAEIAYGGRMGNGPTGSGDGYLFRGAGAFQLTGRENHTAMAKSMGVYPEALPAILRTPKGAAESAGWFWMWHLCANASDRGDPEGVRRAINGGTIGLSEVLVLRARVLGAL